MENSELDLYDLFLKAKGAPEIPAVAADMAKELGAGGGDPALLHKLAQYEVALTKFMEANLGASQYAVFANKCWPAYESYFGFVPCYVNSRLAARGIPISCEVDIYGSLSEYMATCATMLPATLLDINNTVPYDMFKAAGVKDFPKTMDELVEVCRKSTVPGKQYGYGMVGANDATFIGRFLNILYAFHGDFLTPDGKKAAINNEAGVAAFQFYGDLLNKYKVAQPSAVANSNNDVRQLKCLTPQIDD